MSLYNLLYGVNPATFYILPMLGRHPDEYPRFRDCGVTEDEKIFVLTRVGGGNRNEGLGEEELYKDPHFVNTFDAEWDSTYGYYIFNVPDEWKKDFDAILRGERPSKEYIDQVCRVYPRIADKLRKALDTMGGTKK